MKKGDKIRLTEYYSAMNRCNSIVKVGYVGRFSIELINPSGDNFSDSIKEVEKNTREIIPYLSFKKHLIKNNKGIIGAWIVMLFFASACGYFAITEDWAYWIGSGIFLGIIYLTLWLTKKQWSRNWEW